MRRLRSACRLYLHSLQLYKLNLPHCPCSLQVTHREPYALYEYKPNVDSSLLSIDRRDFAELLLQAFYTLRSYNVESCLFCLTSLTSWHYFRFTLKGRKLSCLQRQTFHSRDRYVASSKAELFIPLPISVFSVPANLEVPKGLMFTRVGIVPM